MTGEMAGERDVLAEALQAAGIHHASLPFPLPEFADTVLGALEARGYTLSRSEPTIGDCSCVDAGASGHRVPCRLAAPSPEPLPLDGRAVHAAWRDGMLAQGRPVSQERMAWWSLSEQDRQLDDIIAAALREDRPT